MAQLFVQGHEGLRRILFEPGSSLLELLREAGVRVRSGCGGGGTCGSCRVLAIGEALPPPTALERARLTPRQIADGLRLACQVRPQDDLTVQVADSLPVSSWALLEESAVGAVLAASVNDLISRRPGLGVAVDLGTAQLKLTLWDLAVGKRLTGCSGMNPQNAYGADVVTRLVVGAQAPEEARRIAKCARDAVGEGIREMVVSQGRSADEIDEVLVVGNTAMLLLFAERDIHLLLDPENWSRWVDCGQAPRRECAGSWGLAADARVDLVPGLAGFVGSDLLACVLATRLVDDTGAALLIDFGTNSEIALWDGKMLWVTSAAGGPAFEGCGLRFGMPAEPGAIFRGGARRSGDGLCWDTIGGAPARGVCGTGLVDCIAWMLDRGEINRVGRFTFADRRKETPISCEWPEIMLSERDLDLFQRAKAAIGAGVGQLMACSGLRERDLRRVCVCGTFGRFLNIQNAQAIGLLPQAAPDTVALCGNAALAGCERLLLRGDRAKEWARLKQLSRVVNLAQVPEYENLFVENLRLGPMRLA